MSGARYLQCTSKPKPSPSSILALAILTFEPTIAGGGFFSSFRCGNNPIQSYMLKKQVRKFKQLVASLDRSVDEVYANERVMAGEQDVVIEPILKVIKGNLLQSMTDTCEDHTGVKAFPLPQKQELEDIVRVICQLYPDQDERNITRLVKRKIKTIGIKKWRHQMKGHIEAVRALVPYADNEEMLKKIYTKLDKKYQIDYAKLYTRRLDLYNLENKTFDLCLSKAHLLPANVLDSEASLPHKLEEALCWEGLERDMAEFTPKQKEWFLRDLQFYLGSSEGEVVQSKRLSQARHDVISTIQRKWEEQKSDYTNIIMELYNHLTDRIDNLRESEIKLGYDEFIADLGTIYESSKFLEEDCKFLSMKDAIAKASEYDVVRFWRRHAHFMKTDNRVTGWSYLFALYNLCSSALATAIENPESKIVAEALLQVVNCVNRHAQFPTDKLEMLSKIVATIRADQASGETVC